MICSVGTLNNQKSGSLILVLSGSSLQPVWEMGDTKRSIGVSALVGNPLKLDM